MGWNDRLPEDPHIPYESAQDRDDYDAWAEYVEFCRAEEEKAGLTSQTIDPKDRHPPLSRPNHPEKPDRSMFDKFMAKFIGKHQ